MNRVVICACVAVLAVLMGALVLQSARVAGLKVELASARADLREAATRISLAEESEAALASARDGLIAQVEACLQANARGQAAAGERADIMKNAKTAPAQPGQVVDDATSSRATRHINGAAGR